eukprot:GHVS01095882.1.p2 GENE.GHVS01095882.1~~GHVS01095882.1.p2  ORF type:complete len:117 (+),score=26.07 GHVS01095882.1:130-480(+)
MRPSPTTATAAADMCATSASTQTCVASSTTSEESNEALGGHVGRARRSSDVNESDRGSTSTEGEENEEGMWSAKTTRRRVSGNIAAMVECRRYIDLTLTTTIITTMITRFVYKLQQ